MNFLFIKKDDSSKRFFVCCVCFIAAHNMHTKTNKTHTITVRGLFAHHHLDLLFTDLSAAGLPAELKHITQRRKRKQP